MVSNVQISVKKDRKKKNDGQIMILFFKNRGKIFFAISPTPS